MEAKNAVKKFVGDNLFMSIVCEDKTRYYLLDKRICGAYGLDEDNMFKGYVWRRNNKLLEKFKDLLDYLGVAYTIEDKYTYSKCKSGKKIGKKRIFKRIHLIIQNI